MYHYEHSLSLKSWLHLWEFLSQSAKYRVEITVINYPFRFIKADSNYCLCDRVCYLSPLKSWCYLETKRIGVILVLVWYFFCFSFPRRDIDACRDGVFQKDILLIHASMHDWRCHLANTSCAMSYLNGYLEKCWKVNRERALQPLLPPSVLRCLASGCLFPERCGFSCWNVTVRLLCSTAHSFEVTSAARTKPYTAPNDLGGLNEIKHRFFFSSLTQLFYTLDAIDSYIDLTEKTTTTLTIQTAYNLKTLKL